MSDRSHPRRSAPRAVPPIPHPSWTFGSEAVAALAGQRLTAHDFWERLGL